MATDPIDPAARARLDDAMEEARAELDLTWREVATAAGMTTEGIRNIRKGPSGIPPRRRRALERVFKWPRNEVDRILGEATPHEWSAEERRVMRSMSLDDAILFGQKLKTDEDEHTAVVWLQEWAKERDAALSPEDSPL